MTRTGCLLLAVFMALAETSWCQRYSNWRVFKAADGLRESGCISVSLGANGKILAKHFTLEFVSQLDGYGVSVIPAPELGRNRIYESPGGQLWTVTPNGLAEFRSGNWVLHSVPEITAAYPSSSPLMMPPVPLCVVKQGLVVFVLPDRLMQFDAEEPDRPRTEVLRDAGQTGLEKFLGMTPARDGRVWITGRRGLANMPLPTRGQRVENDWQEYLLPATLDVQDLQQPQPDQDGAGVTCVAETRGGEQKVVVHFDGQNWTAQPIGREKIRCAWRGADKVTWVATMESLFQLENGEPEVVDHEDVSARHNYDLVVEASGIFWMATADGLFRYSPPLWRSPKPVRKLGSAVHCLVEGPESQLWFVAGNALHALQNERHQEYPFPGALARSLQDARGLFPLKNGALLIDAGERLFQFHPATGVFSPVLPENEGRSLKIMGAFPDGRVCLQNSKPLPGQNCGLEIYEGTGFTPFPSADPVPCGGLSVLFVAQNGDFWLSGTRGIAWHHDNKWRTFSFLEPGAAETVIAFIELPDQKIWCATADMIWEFDGRNWSLVRTGFDRISGMARSRDGSVWVASNAGLYRFFLGTWIENGVEEGLPGASIRQVYEDRRGNLWAGTTHGLSRYYHDADMDPPHAYFRKLSEKEETIPEDGSITLNFSGQDKWKYTPRDRLLYSYRLDQHEWSPFQEGTSVPFSGLAPGEHSVQVRAMDRNGNVDHKPDRVVFVVALPWYRETRLVFISLAGLAGALFFAGLAFNRHRQLVRSYAEVEQKVAERTRELEVASRQLLQSQKMNALGTLAAGIAHDFNNILSIVKGSAQIIEDNLENSEKVRTRADRIKTVADQGAGIVRAMLGFSRGSDEHPMFCDINAVVDDTIKLLGDRFLREIEVKFERVPDLPEVPAIREFIQQILLNFIFNAAESMAKRKQVIVSTRRLAALPADLVLKPAAADVYVSVSVQDFGCGISPEHLPRIFEPFFTTKALSARRGTGLGLSMVYELARKLEAGLVAESVVDEGSTFTLVLPVRELPDDAGPTANKKLTADGHG